MLAAANSSRGIPTARAGSASSASAGAAAVSHTLATRMPDLGAAVPFYGNNPPPEEAAKVKAPLLVHLAETDARINNAWPEYEQALKAAGATFEMHMYPGTNHGFNNDTTPRYDEAAAKLAWQRTVDFFNKHLRG
jgi:carboxymethylenebutenolidase